jgi:hypothetical protein
MGGLRSFKRPDPDQFEKKVAMTTVIKVTDAGQLNYRVRIFAGTSPFDIYADRQSEAEKVATALWSSRNAHRVEVWMVNPSRKLFERE